MLGFSQALRLVGVPFPDILSKTSYIAMVGMLTVMPIVVAQFTKSYVITPVLTLGGTFGFLMIHCVAIQLEAPFGEDLSDLPLLELHTAFNDSLLSFASIGRVETEANAEIVARLARLKADSTSPTSHTGRRVETPPVSVSLKL